jgi:hypothetical protein
MHGDVESLSYRQDRTASDCGNHVLKVFLKQFGAPNEDRGLSRTFLMIEASEVREKRNLRMPMRIARIAGPAPAGNRAILRLCAARFLLEPKDHYHFSNFPGDHPNDYAVRPLDVK